MANASFWLGTAQASEFHALNVFTYQLSGRGRECAVLKAEDLDMVKIDEELLSYHVMSVSIQRDKEGGFPPFFDRSLNLKPSNAIMTTSRVPK